MTYDEPDREHSEVDRSTLVRELDVVLAEVAERLRGDLATAKKLAERVQSDWRVYQSSRQLRARFGSEDWDGPEVDVDTTTGLLRWLRDLDRDREFQRRTLFAQGQGSGAPRSRAGAVRAASSIGNAADRVAQVRLILERAERPMETGEIADVLDRAGELRGVADARATVSAALSRATRMGVIERVSRGTYQIPGVPEQTGSTGPPTTSRGKEEAADEQEVPPQADI